MSQYSVVTVCISGRYQELGIKLKYAKEDLEDGKRRHEDEKKKIGETVKDKFQVRAQFFHLN